MEEEKPESNSLECKSSSSGCRFLGTEFCSRGLKDDPICAKNIAESPYNKDLKDISAGCYRDAEKAEMDAEEKRQTRVYANES